MLQAKYVARCLQRRQAKSLLRLRSGQALARFAGEGRGEGSHALPPHPNPLPHEDVVEREGEFLSRIAGDREDSSCRR